MWLSGRTLDNFFFAREPVSTPSSTDDECDDDDDNDDDYKYSGSQKDPP